MEWWPYIQQFGPGAVLLAGLGWSGYKQLWVFGWQHSEMRRERDAWRQIALRGTELAESLARLSSGNG